MQAKRIDGFSDLDTSSICYWKAKQDGKDVWLFYHPGCGAGNLSDHNVTEHEDGTITVSPSILTYRHTKEGRQQVHGYLKRGIWEDC